MIANGTIGGSSKIATVEIRLKCSARTPAYFANAGSQPQTGLGDCARRKCGKRRNAVVALLWRPAAFKIIRVVPGAGPPRAGRGARADERMNAVGSSRAHEAAQIWLPSCLRKVLSESYRSRAPYPTLEWPSAIRGADQMRLRCAYPAGLAPRPAIVGRKPRLQPSGRLA